MIEHIGPSSRQTAGVFINTLGVFSARVLTINKQVSHISLPPLLDYSGRSIKPQRGNVTVAEEIVRTILAS